MSQLPKPACVRIIFGSSTRRKARLRRPVPLALHPSHVVLTTRSWWPLTPRYKFVDSVAVDGAVEQWMTAVEAEMRSTLRAISREGVFHYAKTPRLQWVDDNVGMVALVGTQIWWTWGVEDAFAKVLAGNKHGMKE